MKQTNTLQLNQWEKTDRIQMQDFNNDNAKIEAAITAARADFTAEIKKLRDDLDEIIYIAKPTHDFNGGGGPNKTLYFPFSILELSKIRELHLIVWPCVATPTQLTVRVGNVTAGTLTTGERTEDVHDVPHTIIISFYPYFCPKSRIHFSVRGLDTDVMMTSNQTYAQAGTFTISAPSYDLLNETRFKAYVYH